MAIGRLADDTDAAGAFQQFGSTFPQTDAGALLGYSSPLIDNWRQAFAYIAPILAFMGLGMLDVWSLASTSLSMHAAVQSGAKYLIQGGSGTSKVQDIISAQGVIDRKIAGRRRKANSAVWAAVAAGS